MNSNCSYSPETPNLSQHRRFFLSRVTLKSDRSPSNTIGHLFYATLNFVPHHFIAIGEFKLELESGNAQIGAKFILTSVTFTFDLCDLDLWPLTLTFCVDIFLVNGNYSWKYHDDMMTGTLWKRCDGRAENNVPRAAWSQLCISWGRGMPMQIQLIDLHMQLFMHG